MRNDGTRQPFGVRSSPFLIATPRRVRASRSIGGGSDSHSCLAQYPLPAYSNSVNMPSAVLLLVCALASSVLPYASGHCVATKATCFRDDPEARLLPYPSRRPAPHGDLTRQTCMQLCADAGYVLAGAEDGGQCFCGNATATGAEPASSAACNMPCRGNASETCGGNDRIVVLEFQCAGPPDPSPRPAPAPSPPPSPPLPPPTPPPSGALNVLSIMVDDLRPQLGCFNISVCGGKKMVTPHIDALAERGLTFRHAYTQYAVCSPSRNSFMSGRRPDTTLTYNFKDSFRTVPARGGAPPGNAWVSYPEYFKLHGYNTTGCGKTYHSGHPKNFDQPTSWTTGVEYVGYNQGLGFCGSHAACELGENDTQHFTDDGLAARAIELMSSHKTHGISPWFVAVGFIRPHVDWSSPSRFWENYPEEECSHDVAKHRSAPSTSPRIAWVDGGYVDKKSADVGPGYHFNATTSVNDTVAALWRRGYYSAVSYVDWNIGKVLTELRSLEFEENTVVVLNADHGYVSIRDEPSPACGSVCIFPTLNALVPLMLSAIGRALHVGKVHGI